MLAVAAFLLMGTIGIDTFSHFCKEDGLAVSYFVEDESVCDMHQHDTHSKKAHCEMEEKAPCCQEDDPGNCCSTSSAHFQVKLDFFSSISVNPILFQELSIAPVWEDQLYVEEEAIRLASCPDPPERSNRQILVDIQQWLI